ncbi:MAG: hypothetical protein OEZ10_03860 [Gammaproteobacteria bacterium]|nr:hypothetical protein [Gammaproteobacteria bacterium]
MSGEEYAVLLWTLGSRPQTLISTLLQVLAAWGSLVLTRHIVRQFVNTMGFYLDRQFWNEKLEP